MEESSSKSLTKIEKICLLVSSGITPYIIHTSMYGKFKEAALCQKIGSFLLGALILYIVLRTLYQSQGSQWKKDAIKSVLFGLVLAGVVYCGFFSSMVFYISGLAPSIGTTVFFGLLSLSCVGVFIAVFVKIIRFIRK